MEKKKPKKKTVHRFTVTEGKPQRVGKRKVTVRRGRGLRYCVSISEDVID